MVVAVPHSIRRRPGQPVPLTEIPQLELDDFRATLLAEVDSGGRVVAFFGQPIDRAGASDAVRLFAVVAFKDTGTLSIFATLVRDSFPSLTPECPQVHWFEREIAEQWGVVPVGHPWFKP